MSLPIPIVPTFEPTRFEAGTNLIFRRSLPDYSPSTWTLTYYLRHATLTGDSFAATADGSDFAVNVAAATTAAWSAGTYLLTGILSNGTTKLQVYREEILILPDAAASSTLDYTTYNQKQLALVEALITGAVARREISYSINGRTFTAKTDEELFKARDYFKSCIAQEKAEADGVNRKVLFRFVRPT